MIIVKPYNFHNFSDDGNGICLVEFSKALIFGVSGTENLISNMEGNQENTFPYLFSARAAVLLLLWAISPLLRLQQSVESDIYGANGYQDGGRIMRSPAQSCAQGDSKQCFAGEEPPIRPDAQGIISQESRYRKGAKNSKKYKQKRRSNYVHLLKNEEK